MRVKVLSNEEINALLRDDNYFFIRSYRLSRAIEFLTNERPIIVENRDEFDKDKNPKLFFYKKTNKVNEALDVLLSAKSKIDTINN